MNTQRVWFVTGASKGLGLVLVNKLLAKGIRVAATSRNVAELKKATGENEQLLGLAVDLKNESSVQDAIEKTIAHFGRIDVIVNNAGYGLLGGIEELTDEESRENFNVNVFGSLNVIRKALPYLRAQQSGNIFNISSIGGFTGAFPGFGIYCATKFAMEGFSESLSEELKPFGIKVTIVSPGYFRTSFLSEGSLITPKNAIDAYTEVRATQNTHQQEINNQQPGDPGKAMDVFIEMSEVKEPPLHLFLGKDAYRIAKEKIIAVQKDMNAWEAMATSTNF